MNKTFHSITEFQVHDSMFLYELFNVIIVWPQLILVDPPQNGCLMLKSAALACTQDSFDSPLNQHRMVAPMLR